jgi:hypothetical protein
VAASQNATRCSLLSRRKKEMETIEATYNVTQDDGFDRNPIGPMSEHNLRQHLSSRILENATPNNVIDELKRTGRAKVYFLPPISLSRTRVEIQLARA